MGMKGTAYQYALDAYTNKFKEKYETYQKPEDEIYIHEEAWKDALAAYRRASVGEMPMAECPTVNLMREKRNEYRQLNNQIKDNADKNNNAAHNKALTFYRDGMQDEYVNIFGFDARHSKSENTAHSVYEQAANKGFQSYQINKTSLRSGIDAVHRELAKQRTVGNWLKSWVGKQKYVVIPHHLLK
ncbi:uncharacterized protein LOC117103718 isoform X1 [Anneissia japonica]|uniref:uncharacterized protein LOC117103718 isoform X1 n=2 Tax=Anneissia japonica TaxID=1529436 RepID=UPI0014254E6D|nr:uncharacterized protein LOC117103718 isoform X1 [Anneissia japonica]